MHSTWLQVEDEPLDLIGYVPSPVPTEAELAALVTVLADDHLPGDDWLASEDWPTGEDRSADEQGCPWPGETAAAGFAAARSGLERATLDADQARMLADTEIIDTTQAAGAVLAQGVTAAFAMAREAQQRKLHLDVGMGLVDWLRVRMPLLHPGTVNDLATCARLADTPGADVVADALAAGQVAAHRAAKVARCLEQLQAALRDDPERARAYGRISTDAAARTDLSDRELDVVCRSLVSDLIDAKPEDEREPAQEALRNLTRRPLGNDMTRYTFDAPPSDAAIFDGIIDGPLARPAPDTDTGKADLRSSGQRRFDALRTVVRRGTGNPGAPPSTARASVMVTVRADPATGRPTGAAHAHTGQSFTASQAGLFACLGDLTPVALGPFGEPLALGRTTRLATPAQFKALMVRDEHCTYPGCSMPGTWCEAHHIIWWSRGGTTDIVYLVLLCPRHHTLVHDKDLKATVNGAVVTWHV